MTEQRRFPSGAPAWALLAVTVAALYSAEAAALPPAEPTGPASRMILAENEVPAAPAVSAPDEQTRAPFAELNAALAAARARLEELSKAAAVAAKAGQARQELTVAKQENERLRAQVAALQQTSENAAARIAELTKGVDAAAAEVKRIEDELATVRRQNAELSTSLDRAQAARDQTAAEARTTQAALSTKVDALTKSAEQSAAETARLRTALADAEHRLEVATSAQKDGEARVADLQAKVQSAEAKSSQLGGQLTTLRSRVAQAESERDEARARAAELAPEADQLRAALGSAEAEVQQATSARRDLEQEVAQLRNAAGAAADAARQNLLAVEARIKELNTALLVDSPAADGARPADGTADDLKAVAAAASAAPTSPGPKTAQASPASTPAAEPAPPTANAGAASGPTQTAAIEADVDLIKSAHANETSGSVDLTRATANLPLEQRLQVQGLLLDLGAKLGPQGLALTVPGQGLFARNSETIEPTAHDTLAKVAELIDAYKGHPVRIIGYTDSIGEASYNKTLSQRRAALVKEFFVDNFEIDGSRVSTEGRGEDEPIESNDTPTGREANRRIEVLILN
jgi:flagellar motor protein MotB